MSDDRTFAVHDPFRCPQCDRESVIGILLVDDHGKHQHTWYVCSSWPYPEQRCGWTGWKVPAAQS